MGFAEGAQPALDQGRVGQHPAVQGGVIDLEAALEEQLLDVTVAERIAQIPRDRLQDQRRFVVTAFEIVLRPALQLLDKGVQDHRPPPVRRRICRPHAQRRVNAKTLRQPQNQDPEQAEYNLRGKFTTDADGRFWFRSVKMVGYPIPTDTVVGRLLKAQDRHPYRPAHLHALIFKPGFKVLISQVYDPHDPNIDSDVQFGVTKALIGDFVRHDDPHPIAADVQAPWYALEYVSRMEPGEAVLRPPPIK